MKRDEKWTWVKLLLILIKNYTRLKTLIFIQLVEIVKQSLTEHAYLKNLVSINTYILSLISIKSFDYYLLQRFLSIQNKLIHEVC